MKFWQFVKNQSGERELRIEGVIAEEPWFNDDVSPKEFKRELNSGKGAITVWINSPGGDFFAGVEIYNALKEYSGAVTVKIDALAASAASVIAMAGDTVGISPAGTIMIHNPWTQAEGESKDMEAVKRMLDSIKDSIINAYVLKTGQSRNTLSRMMDDETFMDANKALRLGFADNILYGYKSSAADITSSKASAYTGYWHNIAAQLVSKPTPNIQAMRDRLEKNRPPEVMTMKFHDYLIKGRKAEVFTNRGEYAFPLEFNQQAADAMRKRDFIRQYAQVYELPVASRPVNGSIAPLVTGETAEFVFPTDDGTIPQWWDGSGSIPVVQVNDMTGASLIAYPMKLIIRIPVELVRDFPGNMEQYFMDEYSFRFAKQEEATFLAGDGVGKPLGVLNTPGVNTYEFTTAVSPDGLIDMLGTLEAPYRDNAIWVMSYDTYNYIQKAKDSSGDYLYNDFITYGAGFKRLLGRPIFVSPYLTGFNLMVGDFSQFIIIDQYRAVQVLHEKYADTGFTGYLTTQSTGTAVIRPQAFTVATLEV
jgi:ATP-dependent Clp protease protease subunit